MHVEEWLQSIPSIWVYVLVAGVIGIESLGIPLPGEIMLVSASLLAAKGVVDPVMVGVCASAGAIVGDSIGYLIGRKGGKPLFDRLGRRFPRHFAPHHIAKAEQTFTRWGMWAVFFGRFIALLRILAGPLAGALRMPYWRFLVANVLGGVAWAGGTAAAVYSLGVVADEWLKGFSWVGLVLAVVAGLVTTMWLKRRATRAVAGDEPVIALTDDAAIALSD
ncbi:DedA family protein [Streptosporangiaceae bacterium NEAU-GS5]|nr:DedA family protein [Streptosporangiaceae bacterium NEAU-GS5]